jgi:Xaa-Pro dipeptidase
VFDPINIRYATGSRNMQVWTMHNLCRYAFITTDGPVILFDLGSSKHLAEGLETIDEVRTSLAWDYMMVADRGDEMACRWAEEIADLVRQHGGGNTRLALDRADWLAVGELQSHDLILEDAKAIKSREELTAIRYSYDACEASIADLKAAITPGMQENEALGLLLSSNIARGGEYPETRLLTSGPRTNPWFQETSDRVMEAGDFLSFETDLIGRSGFYTDISRSWIIGGGMPTDEQRRLYEQSVRQLEHNIALLRPGICFSDYAKKSYQLPEKFLRNRYADVAHGCGLGVEYPLIWYPEDAEF